MGVLLLSEALISLAPARRILIPMYTIIPQPRNLRICNTFGTSCITDPNPSPTTPEDLTTWSWIKLEQLPNARTFYRNGLPQLISYPYQISVNSVEAVKQYCLLGAGLATLSVSQVADSVNKGELIHVLPEWEIKPIPLYALWPGNVTPQSNVKRLLKVLTGE